MLCIIVNMSDVKHRMVEKMVTLLATKGLQRSSFTEVLQASGAPRGSLYHHFPGGKDELVLAAIGVAGDQAIRFLDTLDGQSAVDVARAFLSLWRLILERSNLRAGCAIVAVTVAADSLALQRAAARAFHGWQERLATLLTRGGVPKDRATAIAALLISASEGAVALARAEKSFAPFDAIVPELLKLVETASAGPAI
jgi:TetR/AcrR family transcriptional regulator, lmrAB and yxaGH operons repressor